MLQRGTSYFQIPQAEIFNKDPGVVPLLTSPESELPQL